MSHSIAHILPGFGLLAVIAAVAHVLGGMVPVVTPLILAIVIGALIAIAVEIPVALEKGISKHSLLLEIAIVLLAARISLSSILAAGLQLGVLVVAVVGFGVLTVSLLAKAMKLDGRMGALLAAGSSICGISAIAAVAPICRAKDSQIALAAATILLFDAVTLLIFPVIGKVLELEPQFYGIWVGLSLFSTGPVAAAGFTHSTGAGEWATITKLARNSLIGVVAIGYSLHYTGRDAGRTIPRMSRIWTKFPKFLIGFLLLAAVTATGFLPEQVVDSLIVASDVLFLLAFAGLGFDISLTEMQKTGLRPVAVVAIYLVLVSGFSFLLITLAF